MQKYVLPAVLVLMASGAQATLIDRGAGLIYDEVQDIDPGGGLPLQGSGYGCTGSEMGHLFDVDGITAYAMGPFTNV